VGTVIFCCSTTTTGGKIIIQVPPRIELGFLNFEIETGFSFLKINFEIARSVRAAALSRTEREL
jgi:hypothetical protein